MDASQFQITNSLPLPPPVFVCSYTKQVMEDPIINQCGHLFNQKVLANISSCPIDKSFLTENTCIPLSDLKKAISDWKLQQISLSLSSQNESLTTDLKPLEHQVSVMNISIETSLDPIIPYHVIKDAHYDDIHGIIRSESGFITGSKDTKIKMWTNEGTLEKTIHQEKSSGYKSWITALHRFSNGYWAYGTREGKISILDQRGKALRTMSNDFSGTHICKERNKLRINCITELFTNHNTSQFYVGTPQYVQLWDGFSKKMLNKHLADKNDWVYCIETLPNNRLAIVYGSTLQVWNMPDDQQNGKLLPKYRSNLITAQKFVNKQREHISSIVKFHDQAWLACAVFDGTLRLVDIDTKQTFKQFHEHQGRVWSVVQFNDNLIASSADDSKIKLWDVRMAKSIQSIVGGAGRVSNLLVLNENTLLSGSCPDDVFQSKEKARLSFWDLRTFLPEF